LTIKISFYTNIFLSGKLIKIIDRTEDSRTAKKQNNTSVTTKNNSVSNIIVKSKDSKRMPYSYKDKLLPGVYFSYVKIIVHDRQP
jgi:hypothetical protein